MEKLIIIGRTNWKDGFSIRFRAEEKSMKKIKKIVEEMGSSYFVDNHVIPKTFSNYEKWKDTWIPVSLLKHPKISIDIICGDKIIHMLVHKCTDYEPINKILDKYCHWSNPKYKKVLNQTWEKVNKLTKKELIKLADLLDIGFDKENTDREDIVMILTTNSGEPAILKALKLLS